MIMSFATTNANIIIANTSSKSACGDINGDGKVNVMDINWLKSYLLGNNIEKLPLSAADIDADGKITNYDISELIMYLLGNIPAFSNELNIDSDNDGLCDFIEKMIGTNVSMVDSDNDGINDFEEFYYYNTNPKNSDSDKKDTLVDSDNDGLSNKDEIANGSNIFCSDTDGDGISDKGEIKLGLQPTEDKSDGTPDNKRLFKQTIKSENEILSEINSSTSPYKLSIDLNTSGYADEALKVTKSAYSSFFTN